MTFSEKKTGGEVLYNGKILRLSVDEVELPNGSVAKREIIHHSGGAAVLFVRDECILLVKQFRYAYNKEIYEIPAGKLEPSEPPENTAARELEEETGYTAGNLKKILTLYPTPGYTDEVIHIYLAENCEKRAAHPDEGEFVSCEFMPINQVVEKIENGEICDAKTVAAVFKYLANK